MAAAPATASTRFFGFSAESSTPIPAARTRVSESSARIHPGVFDSASADGRRRNPLAA